LFPSHAASGGGGGGGRQTGICDAGITRSTDRGHACGVCPHADRARRRKLLEVSLAPRAEVSFRAELQGGGRECRHRHLLVLRPSSRPANESLCMQLPRHSEPVVAAMYVARRLGPCEKPNKKTAAAAPAPAPFPRPANHSYSTSRRRRWCCYLWEAHLDQLGRLLAQHLHRQRRWGCVEEHQLLQLQRVAADVVQALRLVGEHLTDVQRGADPNHAVACAATAR
jgi:hypothetical protein